MEGGDGVWVRDMGGGFAFPPYILIDTQDSLEGRRVILRRAVNAESRGALNYTVIDHRVFGLHSTEWLHASQLKVSCVFNSSVA